MHNLQIRPATKADFTAVHNIMSTQLAHDFNELTFTESELAERWEHFNLEQDTWLALIEDTAVAYLDFDRARSVTLLVLAPNAPTEAGLHLLQLAEKTAKADDPLMAQISAKNNLLSQIYSDAGYQQTLTFINMEIELSQPPAVPELPRGIEIRPYRPETDAHATHLADEEASQDKGYHTPLSFADWQQRMRMDAENFDPTLWFLAWAGDEIAGVCLNFYGDAWQAGWIDHLGVKRPYRQKGLGKALLLHSFAQFYNRGIHKIMLNVDSGSLTNAPRLYESVGMQTIQAYHIYKKETTSIQ